MLRVLFPLVIAVNLTGQAFAQTAASNQRWPERPLRFIVPLPAGAAADVVARLIGQKLSERLGQPVIVENRAGASGISGSEAIAKAQDGHTLGMATSSTHVTAPILNPNLSYDPIKDFTPVALIGVSPYVLTVNTNVPAKNVSELIALAKSKPRTLTYSSTGVASMAHLAAELFSSVAGVELIHVPYKSSTHAVLDLLEGRIDMQFGILGTTLPYVRDGKLRALGVMTDKRASELPEVPSLAEFGLNANDTSLWLAVVMPAQVSSEIVLRLNGEINEIIRSSEVRNALETQTITIAPSTPDDLRRRIEREIELWRPLAAKARVTER
jgi:tripartite-type tricarboxylate transporter receptor subunit TctC